MIERTLNSEQIDTIIASAPGLARRADWNGVRKRVFAARAPDTGSRSTA
jgi:hypothetical protein